MDIEDDVITNLKARVSRKRKRLREGKKRGTVSYWIKPARR
jgi:hypothetical protein